MAHFLAKIVSSKKGFTDNIPQFYKFKTEPVGLDNFFLHNCESKNKTTLKLRIETLELAQRIKSNLTAEFTNKALLSNLKDIAIRIQKRIDRKTLKQADVNTYLAEIVALIPNISEQQLADARMFILCCLLLSKHLDYDPIKSYYFNSKNKTTYITTLIEVDKINLETKVNLNEGDILHLLSSVVDPTNYYAKYSKTDEHSLADKSFLPDYVYDSIKHHMREVCKMFKTSPTAQYFNHEITFSQLMQLSDFRNNPQFPDNLIKNGIANCREMAAVIYVLIQSDPLISDKIKNSTIIASLLDGEDHIFVVIKDSENKEESVVVDSWISFTQYGKGFIGLKSKYLQVLRTHEDGRLLKYGYLHNRVKNQTFTLLPEKYFQSIKRQLDEYHQSKDDEVEQKTE